VTQLLITKDEMEIYFHRFEEFFKTLKFQIRNKSEFSASINFAFPRREMLLEILPQNHLPWESSFNEMSNIDSQAMKVGTMHSIPSEIGSWGSSIFLRSESNDPLKSRQSIFSCVQSPMCKVFIFCYCL
jgi:hypothetical protein